MSWLIPDYKLDFSQLEILQKIEESNDNFLIKGYAGSGKTILLVYSYIRKKQGKSNIIFVTYTHALIDMIEDGIPEEVYKDIPIVTYFKFQKMPNYWDVILVDEVQDIPKEYIEQNERILIYKRYAEVLNYQELKELNEEIKDRFGKIPVQMMLFITSIKIKLYMLELSADKFVELENSVKIYIKGKVIELSKEEFNKRLTTNLK